MLLSVECLRVLGSLMEKEMVTPETYPLSINALLLACNQRSSREPVMTLEEDEVRSALEILQAQDLVAPSRETGRVQKYEHRIRTVLSLRRDETALLCLLLLRGPQTPGELRSRAERMFAFDDVPQMQSALQRLATREEPLVTQLPRQPGSRESRWSHLLGDARPSMSHPSHDLELDAGGEQGVLAERLALLETRVEALEARLQAVEAERAK